MSESKRASTRGSGAKKGAQKYQNTTAYRHNKNSKKTREINALPISGLCQRCLDVLEWRKRFRKYKPLTTAKKCVCCQQKAIKEAYHVLCNKCATEKKVCAKCQESKQIVPSNYKDEKELMAERLEEERLLSGMSERERRSYLRKMQNGGESDDESSDGQQSAGEEEEEVEDDEEEEEEDEEEDKVAI